MTPGNGRQDRVPDGDPAGPWSAQAGSDGDAPWTPAMPLGRFWLLMVVSMGQYGLFWVVGVARELRRHQDPAIRPWLYFTGMLVGIASPIVAWALVGHIDRNGRRRGSDFDPPPLTIVTLAVVAPLAQWGSMRFTEPEPWQLDVALLGVYAFIVPLPWALIQLRLNRLKSAMSPPERPIGHARFSAGQIAALLLGGIFWPLALIGSLPEEMLDEFLAPEPDGLEAVRPDTPSAGNAGGYWVTVDTDHWVRAESGTLAEDADLELLGLGQDTWVVVYVLRGEWTMDELVDYRRNEIKGMVRNFSSHERRTLLAGHGAPVSHARYVGRLDTGGRRATWWVSTVVTDFAAIEVLGSTTDDRHAQQEIEAIAKSLRLEPELP